MAALVAAIHAATTEENSKNKRNNAASSSHVSQCPGVDARDERGHDAAVYAFLIWIWAYGGHASSSAFPERENRAITDVPGRGSTANSASHEDLTVIGELAEFEFALMRVRTSEGHSQAKTRDVQREEALAELAKAPRRKLTSRGVSGSTISRLRQG
ncbi:MAG TPA: hypothetical protein VIF40_17505 [Methylosinus sp.]|jgi:hypothetical protein|uniref:hypothetical protein n=1 Tax=Methylosinus sp. TaxID=427 RepID=UPI002F93BC03